MTDPPPHHCPSQEDHAEEEGLDVLEESRAEKQAELESIGGADPTVIAKYDKVQNEVRALSARSPGCHLPWHPADLRAACAATRSVA
jgi:hypothetical protein